MTRHARLCIHSRESLVHNRLSNYQISFFMNSFMKRNHMANATQMRSRSNLWKPLWLFSLFKIAVWIIYSHQPLLLVLGFALILQSTDSTRCWKRSSEILGLNWHDCIAQLLKNCPLHICEGPIPRHPKGALFIMIMYHDIIWAFSHSPSSYEKQPSEHGKPVVRTGWTWKNTQVYKTMLS